MFTGIIQSVGRIEQSTPRGDDLILDINTANLELSDVAIGDSIAVNGVCLTAVTINKNTFTAHVSKETLRCTIGLDPQILNIPTANLSVNLEKALRLNDRLGGHLLSGHVDGTGEVVKFEAIGDCWVLTIRAPHTLSKYIAVKGSIAIHGVSLTVNTVEMDTFSINLIPHTLENTTLKHLKIGSLVNIEVDQIARYVERMTQWANDPVAN